MHFSANLLRHVHPTVPKYLLFVSSAPIKKIRHNFAYIYSAFWLTSVNLANHLRSSDGVQRWRYGHRFNAPVVCNESFTTILMPDSYLFWRRDHSFFFFPLFWMAYNSTDCFRQTALPFLLLWKWLLFCQIAKHFTALKDGKTLR